MLGSAGKYSKAIVAVAGAISTVLATSYSTARWEPGVFAALTALVVFLVPNASGPGK